MLLYLLIGALFSTIGITLITSLADTISVFFELLKAKLSVGIVKCNDEINQINNRIEEREKKHPIGFALNLEEEED